MSKHTPGPWFTFANATCVGGPAGILGNPSGADTAGIAHCGMALRAGDELQANARLIAAAPDLLEALQAMLKDSETVRRVMLAEAGIGMVDENALSMARTAIAKATGDHA